MYILFDIHNVSVCIIIRTFGFYLVRMRKRPHILNHAPSCCMRNMHARRSRSRSIHRYRYYTLSIMEDVTVQAPTYKVVDLQSYPGGSDALYSPPLPLPDTPSSDRHPHRGEVPPAENNKGTNFIPLLGIARKVRRFYTLAATRSTVKCINFYAA